MKSSIKASKFLNKKFFLILSLSATCLFCKAQNNALKYAETIQAEDLKKHLTYIASDSLEGRDTGSEGGKKAAIYIAKQFEKSGLQAIMPTKDGGKSYFQSFNLYKKKGERVKFVGDSTSQVIQTQNVLGFLEGTDKKDEVILITAHYDHVGKNAQGIIYNGADDDGSGTCSIIELAEAFAKAKAEGHGSRRSILFMTVTGEEKGLLGSQYFTDMSPAIPLEKIVCDFNIDMIGRIDKEHAPKQDYVYLIGADKLSSELHKISEETNEHYIKYQLDYTYNDPKDPNRFYYRSDHYNFAKHKIPVIFYFTGVHEDYHQPGDDVEKILFPKYQQIVRLVFLTAWDVANREERIKVDSNKL